MPESETRPPARRDAGASDTAGGGRVGRYVIVGELGRGGMGAVFRAHDPTLRRDGAVQMMLDPAGAGARGRERFIREARAAARLRHPGIVPLHEVGEDAGRPFLVMDLVAGETLEDARVRGRLPPRRVAEIVRALAEALEHAHGEGVLHRDLKPQNVILDEAGRPHLLDFGLARTLDADPRLTASGQLLGTPQYMSPEQARGDGTSGPRSDIWGLGGVLYFALLGHPPFDGEAIYEVIRKVFQAEPPAPRAVDPGVHPDLETITLRCLEKDPERRYASAAAVAEDLRRFLNGEPIDARPIGRVARARRWSRRNRMLAATLVAAAALTVSFVVAGIVGSIWSYRMIQSERDAAIAAQREAEAREAEALDNLALALVEKGNRLLATDSLAARALFARAIALRDSPTARAQLLSTRLGLAHATYARRHPHRATTDLVASDDGRVLAFASSGRVYLHDADGERPPRLLEVEGAPVSAIALSADGRRLALVRHFDLELYDVDVGAPRLTLRVGLEDLRREGLTAATILLEAEVIVVADSRGGVSVLRDRTGERVAWLPTRTRKGDGTKLNALSVVGNVVARGGTTNAEILLTPLDASAPTRSLDAGERISAFALSRAGDRLAFAVASGVIRIVAVDTLALLAETKLTEGVGVEIDWGPGDGRLAIGTSLRDVWLWDLSAHRLWRAHFRDSKSRIDDVRLIGTNRIVTLVDASVGQGSEMVLQVLQHHDDHRSLVRYIDSGREPLEAVSFAPGGDRIVAGGSGILTAWELATGLRRWRSRQHQGGLHALAIDPGGELVATAGSGQDPVNLARLEDGARGPILDRAAAGNADALAWDPAGGRLAARVNARLVGWDIASGRLDRSLPAVPPIQTLAWTRIDGWGASGSPAVLALGMSSMNLHLWDVSTDREVGVVRDVGTTELAFADDGRRVFGVGGGSSGVRVWDLDAGSDEPAVLPHEVSINAMAASVDGSRLATVDEMDCLSLWDVPGRRLIVRLKIGWDLSSAAFSPDGRLLAIAGQTIQIIDVEGVERFLTEPAHALAAAERQATGLRVVGLEAVPDDEPR